MSNVPPPEANEFPRLQRLLSVERIAPYLAATSGDEVAALRLYEANLRAAGQAMVTTGMVEIIVRNALDRGLRKWAADRGHPSWLDAAPLDAQGIADIRKARSRATRHGRDAEIHGKVVAEFTFGFWRYLLASRYLTALWVPALAAQFPHGHDDLGQRRVETEAIMKQLMLVRNRAAHHEPIFRRDLSRDRVAATRITGWIDPAASTWVGMVSEL